MPRIKIPFTGPTYKSESVFVSSQECVNFYLRPGVGGEMILFGTPGLEPWVSLGQDIIKGIIAFNNYLYVVAGTQFKRIDIDGNVTIIGGVDSISTDRVSMATNGLDIVIVGGFIGYVYHISTGVFSILSSETMPNFPGGNNVVHIDGYYLLNKPETGQIWRSDYNDGSSWSGLAFSTAGGDPDNIVSIILDYRDVWTIGEYTTEIWYNTGSAIFNFARIDGAFIEQGCISNHARTRINNGIFWLGQDRTGNAQVFQSVGRQMSVVSTPAICHQISNCILDDAFMFSYQQLSHSFVVLTFPSSDLTLVYDTSTKMWHERSSMIGGENKRWRANCHALFDGNHIVGDYANGKLYKLKTDVYTENDGPLVAIRTTPVIRENQNQITVNQVQLVNEPGVGLITGEVEDINPCTIFSWSKDGGRRWSSEVELSLGKIGESENRTKVCQLGQGRNWMFKYKISAAVPRILLSAVMDVEVDYD